MLRKLMTIAALLAVPLAASGEERVLTLQEAVQTGLKNNPRIISAREDRNAADSRTYQARSSFMPQMQGVLSYARATSNSPAYPGASSSFDPNTIPDPSLRAAVQQIMSAMSSGKADISSTSYNNFNVAVTVNQLIWDFGRSLGAYDAAKASARAADADLQTALDDVEFTVIQAYFGVLALQEAVAAATEVKGQMEKHLELADAQVTAGTRPRIDVTRAQSDLASARLTLVQTINALRTGKVTLCISMGELECGEYKVISPSSYPDVNVAGTEEAVNEALKKRPEYRSIREGVKALEGTLSIAKSAYYPMLMANGTVNYAGIYIDGMAYNWSVGASAVWNFFSGLDTKYSVQEARANIRSLQAAMTTLELNIRLDVESALLALKNAQEKLDPANALFASAKETRELAEGRYAAGAGSIVEVTDAQASYVSAYSSLISVQYDLKVAISRVLKSLGRLAENRAGA
jgi:outer membrane protein TolC